LAARQAELVAALVAGGPLPAGFDAPGVAAAERALRRKRAGEVAQVWPLLAAGHGDRWVEHFCRWSAGRAPNGALRDGWDLARELAEAGRLPALAGRELAEREVAMRYDGRRPPRPRRIPTVRRRGATVVLGCRGWVHQLGG
jgi:hypothetical protein